MCGAAEPPRDRRLGQFDLQATDLVAPALLAPEPSVQCLGCLVLRRMDFNPLAITVANSTPFPHQGWVTEEGWFNAQNIKARDVLYGIRPFQDKDIELFRNEPLCRDPQPPSLMKSRNPSQPDQVDGRDGSSPVHLVVGFRSTGMPQPLSL